MINGPTVRAKLTRSDNRIGKLLSGGRPNPVILDEIYLATVSRIPTAEEREAALEYVAKSQDRRGAWEDLQWALLNTKEFLFRH